MRELNEKLFVYINGQGNNWLDQIMRFTSSFWIVIFCFMILTYYSFLYFKNFSSDPMRKTIFLVSSMSLICLVVTAPLFYIFPNIIDIPPPCLNPNTAKAARLLHPSCVDSVASFPYRSFILMYLAFFLIGTFGFRFKRTGIIFFILALLVSYSRVYLGVHYPLNVLLSGLLGALIGFFSGLPHFILLVFEREPQSQYN